MSRKAFITGITGQDGSYLAGLIGENPLGKPKNLYPLITKVGIGKLKKLKRLY